MYLSSATSRFLGFANSRVSFWAASISLADIFLVNPVRLGMAGLSADGYFAAETLYKSCQKGFA